MSSLSIIQKIVSIVKIVSLVLAIFSLIAAGGMLVGGIVIFAMPFLNNYTWFAEIMTELGAENAAALGFKLIGGSIVNAGQGTVLIFAHRYCDNELKDGTPFTRRGAKELMILGIITAAVPSLSSIVSSSAGSVSVEFPPAIEFSGSTNNAIALGLVLVFMSFVLRYGAELESAEKNNEKECESENEDVE